MSSFLMYNEDDTLKKVNIDELYEKRKNRDMRQLSIFNKILNRIHRRIELTGKNKRNDKHVWFQVPEFIFGEDIYDKGHCIAYLVSKLEDNGFHVKYVQPNFLFVSWANFVPTYIRNEVKKKTGIVLDERGNVVRKKGEQEEEEAAAAEQRQMKESVTKEKNYTPIKNYKPTGHLVYNPELFEKIEKKVSFV